MRQARPQRRACLPGGGGSGGGEGRLYLKGEGEQVWGCMKFSILGYLIVKVAHWFARAYVYFEVGGLMGQMVTVALLPCYTFHCSSLLPKSASAESKKENT